MAQNRCTKHADCIKGMDKAGTRSDRGWMEVFPVERRPTSPADRALWAQVEQAMKVSLGPRKRPRQGQVEALYQMMYGSSDVLLQAGTGFGKRVIFQLLTALTTELREERSVTLMISPLNSLTEQQVELLERTLTSTKIDGIAVTGDKNNDDKTYEKIGNGEFTHVCISPEMVCARRFREQVIEKAGFRKGRIYLVIDEAHCIVRWSDFRKEYGKFGALRLALGKGARVFGTSATLGPSMRDAILAKGPFERKNHTFINTTTDRPEIYIDIRHMGASYKDMQDLHFLIPTSQDEEKIQELRKCIIFFDNRKTARQACEILRVWLRAAGVSLQAVERAIRPYYAILSKRTKQKILKDFIDKDSEIRILLATDAVGMGVDIPGVSLVVQYGGEQQLKDISELVTIMQRAGRAARHWQEGEEGHFVWILPAWTRWPEGQPRPQLGEFEGQDLSREVAEPESRMAPAARRAKQKEKQKQRSSQRKDIHFQKTHGGLDSQQYSAGPSHLSAQMTIEDDGTVKSTSSHDTKRQALHPLWKMVLWDCPRRAMFKMFHEPSSGIWKLPEWCNPRCCSFCSPSERAPNVSGRSAATWSARLKAVKKLTPSRIKGNDRGKLVDLPRTFQLHGNPDYYSQLVDELKQWRIKMVKDRFKERTRFRPENLLPDRAIDRIATLSNWLVGAYSKELFIRFVENFEYEEFVLELLNLVQQAIKKVKDKLVCRRKKIAYKALQKSMRELRVAQILACREKKRLERFHGKENMPRSEVPGDTFDRADPNRVQAPIVNITTFVELTGRVNNQPASWENAPAGNSVLLQDRQENTQDDNQSVAETERDDTSVDLATLSDDASQGLDDTEQSFDSNRPTAVPASSFIAPSPGSATKSVQRLQSRAPVIDNTPPTDKTLAQLLQLGSGGRRARNRSPTPAAAHVPTTPERAPTTVSPSRSSGRKRRATKRYQDSLEYMASQELDD